MFNIFKKKKIKIVDNRKDKQELSPVKGAIDPVHALLISAAMQNNDVVFGKFDGKTLTIEE